ncbi:hypothetical protein D3C84_1070760 [compost metagenome]
MAANPEIATGLEPFHGLQGLVAQGCVELEEAGVDLADMRLPGIGILLDVQVVHPVLGRFGATEHQVHRIAGVHGSKAERLGLVDVFQLAERAPDRR